MGKSQELEEAMKSHKARCFWCYTKMLVHAVKVPTTNKSGLTLSLAFDVGTSIAVNAMVEH